MEAKGPVRKASTNLTAHSMQASQTDQTTETKERTPVQVICDDDLTTAPLAAEHKENVLRHIHRLNGILHEPYPTSIGLPEKPDDKFFEQCIRKKAAIKQLARITVVFRRHLVQHSHGQLEDGEISDSMVQNIIDASLYDDGPGAKALHFVGASMNPIGVDNAGEQWEMERLVQEMEAENVDDVIELHNLTDGKKTVVPDSSHGDHLGKDIVFGHSHIRRNSDDERLYHASNDYEVKKPEKLPDKLLSLEKPSKIDHRWPPRPDVE